MKASLLAGIAASALAACSSSPSGTMTNPASYPSSFPMQVGQPTPPDDATWYKVSGLTAGTSYLAAITLDSAATSAGDAGVLVERDPKDVGMNDLCTMYVPQNMSAGSCTFSAPGSFAYIGVIGPKQFTITLDLTPGSSAVR